MRKVIIWGMGYDYEKILNIINFEICKGNIQVQAVVCKKEDKFCSKRDGFSVVVKEDLKQIDFDYIIITSSKYFKDIKLEALELGIDSRKIINGEIFNIPLFDFERYAKLIEKPVTILSDDCWGGFVYHQLGLEFSSPLINIWWKRDEFGKFMQEPLYYMNTELTMEREGCIAKLEYPIGRLGTNGKYVYLCFVHDLSFNEAKIKWDRRVKRINKDNLFIKCAPNLRMTKLEQDLYIEEYVKLKNKKVLFYYNEDVHVIGQVCDKRFAYQNNYVPSPSYDYGSYMLGNYHYCIDILKLLNGESDYLRY